MPKQYRRAVIRSDGKRYPSTQAAARDMAGDNTNISMVCRGKRKSAYGYGWRYESESK